MDRGYTMGSIAIIRIKIIHPFIFRWIALIGYKKISQAIIYISKSTPEVNGNNAVFSAGCNVQGY